MINCKACNKPIESSFIAKAGVYWHIGCEYKEPVALIEKKVVCDACGKEVK